jgi:methylamine dehydrogenase accessory protein MauD
LQTFLIFSVVLLWLLVLLFGFLLLGTLRAMGVLSWQLEQLQATATRHVGRSGLKPGRKAPDFALPDSEGKQVSLQDFTGRKVLLVFTQSGCGPCERVMPELNRVGRSEDLQVVVINNGAAEATRKFATEVGASFPVLVQEHFTVAKRYEMFATPFAFLIDERGIIRSNGIINNRQHIRYVLDRIGKGEALAESASNGEGIASDNPASSFSPTNKEFEHA